MHGENILGQQILYNTWIMYVGLAKNELPIAFKHFLSGHTFLTYTRFLNWWNSGAYCCIQQPIIHDKIKCLYLFQCFSEAENDELCRYVGQLLQENKIDLSCQTLSPINVLNLSLFLTRSTTKHWNILNLSECYVGDDGIKQLYHSFVSNNRSKVCIDMLNLSYNNLTRSSVQFIAGLILEWDVKDIILTGIEQHFLNEEIVHQIMQHPIEQNGNNIIWCNFNKNMTFFARLLELEYLILSFSGSVSHETIQRITTTFTKQEANHILKPHKFKAIICTLHSCTTINYLNFGVDISQFEIFDIVQFIRNNKSMEYLYLPKMQCSILYENVALKMIFDALSANKSLKYIDMGLTTIDSNLVKEFAAAMKNKSKFKGIKVSKLLLKDNDFQHVQKFLEKITGLQLISITDYMFTEQDLKILLITIKRNYNIQQLNLSNCNVLIKLLIDILLCESIVKNLKWLNLSSCQLNSKEMRQILCIIKDILYLQHIDLRGNIMTSDATNDMVTVINNNKRIQSLSLPDCVLNQKDLRIIIKAMLTASSLQFVDFNKNEINNELTSDFFSLFANNGKLEQIIVCKLALKHHDFQHLKMCLVRLRGLKYLRITDCALTNQDVCLLESFICSNHNIHELIISNCTINNQKLMTALTDYVGIFDHLEILELSNISTINMFVYTLLVFLSCSTKLKRIILCNCQLQPNEIKQILMVLKYMIHLECVDLSGNAMTDDSVSDMAAMIVNSKQLQKLCLPNCVLNQTNLRMIVQAIQTVSSLQYIDFSTNNIDNGLANDLAVLNHNTLKELNFYKLSLNQNSFQHVKKYLYVIKSLKSFCITDCVFSREDAATVTSIIGYNSKIQEIILSNCKMDIDQLLIIFSCKLKVNYLDLSNCQLDPKEIKQIVSVLKQMESLHCVNLSANSMTDDVANEVAAMITNNKHIQKLHLPNCVLTHISLRNIIQAMQTVSSLEYVDLSTNKVDNDLATDAAIFIANNTKLVQLKITELELDQNGFDYLKIHLLKLRGIKHFNITNCNFTDQDVTNIVITINNNTNIQEIDLSNCNMIYGMGIFKQLKANSLIRYLKLNNTTISDQVEDEVITIISNNSNLEHLEMAGCNLSNSLYVKIIKCSQFQNISNLNFGHNNVVSKEIKQLLFSLSSHTGLKSLDLSNCQLQSNEISQLFNTLKKMKYLQYINLSRNTTTDDVANDIADMIINNKDIQNLMLPDCIFNQTRLRIIIQAMQTVSSLQYVDFSTNILDNELASDVGVLINNNSKLKSFKISQLILNQNCFQHLKNYLEKIEGLQLLSINCCTFSEQDAVKLVTASINYEIQELNLSNCTIPTNALLSIISFNIKLRWLDLSNCHLHSKEIKRLCGVLKQMRHLLHVNLSANSMTDDVAYEMVAMINNNEDIQEIYLPNCILNQTSLRIIIQAMQTVSSLQYVDFSTNTIDNELASDIALLIANNNKLCNLKFSGCTLNQSGFQHVKNYLVKIKGIKLLSITGCNFTRQDAVKVINNSSEIQELSLPNCKIHLDQLLSILFSSKELKLLDLSNCRIRAKKIKRILYVLKQMKSLSHVDLSGNIMTSAAVNVMAAMIKNNKHMQSLSFPNCILDQSDLRIIIQAMQTSSLQYVDFNNNRIDNDLASDVALLITNNTKLKELKFSQLTLKHSGFQHLNNFLVKVKGLQLFEITSCLFTKQDAAILLNVFSSNSGIQKINLSNCIMPTDHLLPILSCTTKLQCLNLSNCLIQSKEIKKILSFLKEVKDIQYINLSANIMKSNTIIEMAAMVKNNKHIRSLSLPSCALIQEDFRIIIQALQTISSLEYVDLSTNEIDNELATDVAICIANNCELEQLHFGKLTLKQSGFQHLKMHFVKFKEIKHLSITDCTLTSQDVVYLQTVIGYNHNIQSLIISNCKLIGHKIITMVDKVGIYNQLEHFELNNNSNTSPFINDILVFLCCSSKLKQIILCKCELQPNEIKQILMVLKYMRHLECVNISGNAMIDDLLGDTEVKAIINNNKQLSLIKVV